MACDFVALSTNMRWAYDNNDTARRLIQEGVLDGGPAGVEKIKQGYKTGQAHNPDTYKHLESCGPMEIRKAAQNITG